MKTYEIPQEALGTMRAGLTAPETAEQAVKMLLALSPDALKYVLKPIEWAYNWTDQNDPDSMTDEDSIRFSLISCALHQTMDFVSRVYKWYLAISQIELERSRKGGLLNE